MRAEVWMRTSGAAKLQKDSPNLYQNLLNAQFDQEIGTFTYANFHENLLFKI